MGHYGRRSPNSNHLPIRQYLVPVYSEPFLKRRVNTATTLQRTLILVSLCRECRDLELLCAQEYICGGGRNPQSNVPNGLLYTKRLQICASAAIPVDLLNNLSGEECSHRPFPGSLRASDISNPPSIKAVRARTIR